MCCNLFFVWLFLDGKIGRRKSGLDLWARKVYDKISGTDLVNATAFALQNDNLQQLGCVTLWVFTWIIWQNLGGEIQVNLPIIKST